MDRPLAKPRANPVRLVLVLTGCALVLLVAWQVMNRTGTTRLKVDASRLTVSQVAYGEFLEYYPFDGTVVPMVSVYLDVEEGGRVEEIFVEGGQAVEEGDPILRFSNATAQRNAIDTETRLLENLDLQRNTQFNRAQSKLILRDALTDLSYQILDLEKKFRRYQMLVEEKSVSVEEFERVRDELEYRNRKRALLEERIRQEDLLSELQLAQANKSIERLTLSLELLGRIVDNLEVRAPISGHLSSIDAELGQNINRGQRIGQIDRLDAFKLRVSIDQFYIARVSPGTPGRFTFDGVSYPVEVSKIYPEVVNNTFQVDMAFAAEPPDGIKRGQTLTVELSFGEPARSLMVTKGGFYQQTGGRWVYLIAADGRSATRANIRLGRQNPRFVEVLEGLQDGDWIVTSGYDVFNEADELEFSEPIGPVGS